METNLYKEFHIAGLKYYDAIMVWKKLDLGTELYLSLDEDNKFDPHAIKIEYKDEENCMHMLGYVPQEENYDMYLFMKHGWGKIFKCFITKVDPTKLHYDTIKVVVKIVDNFSVVFE